MRKKHELPIIGENYPLVGDTIYWRDKNGEIHDNIVMDIDKDPDGNIVTNYFISRTENGGGVFIDEESLINPLSVDILIYKQKRAKEKTKEIADYIAQEEIRSILYNKLRKYNQYDEDSANRILDILSDYE